MFPMKISFKIVLTTLLRNRKKCISFRNQGDYCAFLTHF